MSSREYWFYGKGFSLTALKDFCSEMSYDKLSADLIDNEFYLSNPLDTFCDDSEGLHIIIPNYEIDPLTENPPLDLTFYTKEEVGALLFNLLYPSYLDVEAYKVIKNVEDLSEEAFKQDFVTTVSNCIEEVELYLVG